jgi:hypothetical protein
MQIVSGFIGFPSRSTLTTDDAIAKNQREREREFRGGEMSVFFGRRKGRGVVYMGRREFVGVFCIREFG